MLQTKCKVNPQSIALDWIQSKLPDLHCIFRREFNQPAHCIYQSHHCIVFTGGGISTNTGLNDFTSSMTTVLTSGPGTWTRKENGVQLPSQQSSKWEQRKGLERPMEYNCHYLTGRSGTRPLLLFNYNCLLSIFLLWTFFNCFDSYLYSILIFQVLQTKCKVNPQYQYGIKRLHKFNDNSPYKWTWYMDKKGKWSTTAITTVLEVGTEEGTRKANGIQLPLPHRTFRDKTFTTL